MLQQGRSSEAVSAFAKASDLNPQSATPQLYLALAWNQWYLPGDPSPANVERARLAETALRRALELEPGNRGTLVLLGMLARQERRLEDAREWYRRALNPGPPDPDTLCTLAETGFLLWLNRGKPPAELEPLIREFEASLALDPAHEAAMQYLSLLLRERAAMRPDSEPARQDLAAAQSWQERAADAHSESVQRSIAQSIPHPLESGHPDAYLNFVVSMALQPLPPPPPPPPPPPDAFTAPHTVDGATVVWEPIVAGAPRPLRVPPAVQAEKLITKLEPRAAAGALPENPLRFVVVVGKDGRIVNQILIDGNPWLTQTAEAALRQWVYEPTLSNGEPVEVVTEVRVGFQPEN
jgi:cytochrome c-type biogenesis protein CcmH/NrfG